MVYLPTFGSFMGQMLVNIPYMEHVGYVGRLQVYRIRGHAQLKIARLSCTREPRRPFGDVPVAAGFNLHLLLLVVLTVS